MKKYLTFASLLAVGSFSAASDAGSWQQNVSVGGFNKVHLYKPDSLSAIGQGRGLLVVLHGCTQSVDAFLTANLEQAAEQYGLVVAVPDAMNKAGFSCWSYWQGAKSRTAGDYKNLINLATSLMANTSYQIDPNQVYIAGLSSGAAFAHTTACLAPDIFAGVGVSAGPSIGTSSGGAIGPCETADVASRCAQYAGSYSSHFGSQIASIAHGRTDSTVNQCYNEQNASGMAQLYQVARIAGETVISEGAGRTADQTLWQDGRVSMLWLNNVPHAWSGGQGAGGSYINGSSINYASYLGQYFQDHNPRVNRNSAPELSDITVSLNGSVAYISGKVMDAEGDAVTVIASFTDSLQLSQQVNAVPASDGSFSLISPPLADDWYQLTLSATDSGGLSSTLYTEQLLVGPPPAAVPPELSALDVSVAGQCANVTGQVFDVNRDIAGVIAEFNTGSSISATLNGNVFSVSQCHLPGGTNTVLITATDQTGLFSSEFISFEVDAGQHATLSQHITAGRLDYTNYANCYLEYGTASFTLSEQRNVGEQCRWQDDDASCSGPVKACSTSGGSEQPPVPGNCVSYITNNYSHKLAGRAYSTGNPLIPDYFATGSAAALTGSTWGVTTLSSASSGYWQTGACSQ